MHAKKDFHPSATDTVGCPECLSKPQGSPSETVGSGCLGVRLSTLYASESSHEASQNVFEDIPSGSLVEVLEARSPFGILWSVSTCGTRMPV